MHFLSPRLGCVAVLCHLMLFGIPLLAQTTDSSKSIVFTAQKSVLEVKHPEAGLEGIASLGVGPYSGFHDEGHFGSFLQPNIGFDFLANPGGSLHLLLGGHVGFGQAFTTEFMLGFREPVAEPRHDLKIFTDLGVLFFDDAEFAKPLRYGVRLAFGVRTLGDLNFEYRLAGEWRGTGSDSTDGNRLRTLWWVGAEVGIAFSLVREAQTYSRKDSLREALYFIASADERDELEAITSDVKLDQWLDRFWRLRDLTPDTKTNEARKEFENRIETANRRFSRSRMLGVSTDPGRAMLIYGSPNIEEQDFAIGDNHVKYMEWVFNDRIKGVSFATFIFRLSDQEPIWKQIYSNVPGELTGGVPGDLPVRMQKWVQGF